MKVLVVSQYFWPEEFRINDLCLELSKLGHKVTVLTGIPNYPSGRVDQGFRADPKKYSSLQGVEIIRVPILLRGNNSIRLALNYISFFLTASILAPIKLRRKNFDVIFVCQLSPITVALPAILLKKIKKAPLAMWSLDLWPDSIRAVGKMGPDFAYSMVAKLVRFIYKRCDLIFGQSSEYLQCVSDLDVGSSKKVIFPNWSEEFFDIERDYLSSGSEKRFVVLFAGNIGEAQDFDSIISAAKMLKRLGAKVVFSVVGDGSRYSWLLENIKLYGLEEYFVLHGRHPITSMPEYYKAADAALLSLKPNKIFSVTVPGKLQTYMMAKLPIVGMIDGAGAGLINNANCGVCGPASDSDALVNNIVKLTQLGKVDLNRLGVNGYNYASSYFSRAKLVGMLCEELESLVKNRSLA